MVGHADRYGTLAQPIPMAQSGGRDSTPALHQLAEIDEPLGTADPADHDHSALSGKRLESAWQAGSTDDLEDDVVWTPV